MNIDEIIYEDSKDALDSFNKSPTNEDLAKLMAQSIVAKLRTNPIESIKSLREYNVITDEQYKEMIINIRKTQVEEDFK